MDESDYILGLLWIAVFALAAAVGFGFGVFCRSEDEEGESGEQWRGRWKR